MPALPAAPEARMVQSVEPRAQPAEEAPSCKLAGNGAVVGTAGHSLDSALWQQ